MALTAVTWLSMSTSNSLGCSMSSGPAVGAQGARLGLLVLAGISYRWSLARTLESDQCNRFGVPASYSHAARLVGRAAICRL